MSQKIEQWMRDAVDEMWDANLLLQCELLKALNIIASHAPSEAAAQPTLTLQCVKCGKKYDPEGWDPMGGDCPTVRDLTTGEVISPPEIEHNDH